MPDFRVLALVSAFNEADIISPVIGHLVENGIDVYLIDNHSTDGTVEAARRWLRKGLVGIEKFPAEHPAGEDAPPFDWEAILRRKEELAKELPADWFIHHDADEFREAPWPWMNLRDAIHWVDRLGYNCIDFRVLNFPPLGNGFEPGASPERSFTHWEEPTVHDTLQRKAWKSQKTPISLAASGGHEARFPGRRVFPIRFLLRHYPIRSQEHGVRKVFDERRKRFVEKEREKGWHVQYDSIDESHSFLGDPSKLHAYDPDRVRLDLMLENETTREAEGRSRELGASAEARQKDLETAALLKHEAEKHAANLEKDREKLTSHLVERERHIANLETLKSEAERHSARLEEERKDIVARLGERERQVANLESVLGEVRRHATGLERDREVLSRRVAELEELRARHEGSLAGLTTKVSELEKHAAGLERDRETLTKHGSHLERHSANLETIRAELERHSAALDAERRKLRSELDETSERANVLEGRRLELEPRLAQLEARAQDLEHRFVAMRTRANAEESLRREIESRAATLDRDLSAMRQSTFWRMTAPMRWLLDAIKRVFRD